MLTTIAAFREPNDALMLMGRLDSEGILAFTAHEYHVGNNWIWSTALGGVKVQVQQKDVDEARSVMRRCAAGHGRAELATKFGDLDDPKCPKCGSTNYEIRRSIPSMLLASAFIILGAIVSPLKWICRCNDCGTQFKRGYGFIGKSTFRGFSIELADATAADLPDAIDLFAKVGISPSDAAVELLPVRQAWACRISGDLRGFCIADCATRNLVALIVDPDFERNGIGKRLHNQAVDWLFARGSGDIWTTTHADTKGKKFLYAAGWRLADLEENGDLRFDLGFDRWQKWKAKFQTA